jgi:hypothetical protein
MLTAKDIAKLKSIFVTKEELRDELKDQLKDQLRDHLKNFVTKDDLREQLNKFITKDDFFTKMDALLYEVKAMREEMAVIVYRQSEHSDQLEDHEVRLTKLET